jgi:CYTH domain-containing protein
MDRALMGREVERKFLVDAMPESVRRWPASTIQQGYLAIQGDGTEVRVRNRGGICSLTVKRGTGLERQEVEVPLSAEAFATLWPLTAGRRVDKVRYVGKERGYVVEVDVYHGALDGRVVAEVEFSDVKASQAFEPPTWFGPEVTGDQRYANQHLACQGWPDPTTRI